MPNPPSCVDQRHNVTIERRNQPVLPVDDSLLDELKPLGEGETVERPLILKKLSICADVAGPLLRAWDFLNLNSRVR